MERIGLICEYNPFHNGHLYHINKIKEKYPESVLILIMSGYFTERGDVSLISKYDKSKLALFYGIDVVLELPCLYTLNSADLFAISSVNILNQLGINKIIFGSETDNIAFLKDIASKQDDESVIEELKKYLKQGLNYPTSLSKALKVTLDSNDLLGVSYVKAVNKVNPAIEIETIKRTNRFLDTEEEADIISAESIRKKISNNLDIKKYIPGYNINYLNTIDEKKLFELLKYKIVTDNDLSKYLDVNEGLDNILKKYALDSNNLNELILKIKSKRYTYVRIKRMLMHILIGILKEDVLSPDYQVRIIGLSLKGKKYIKDNELDYSFKLTGRIREIEKNAAFIYESITGEKVLNAENKNKPVMEESYE